MLNHKLEVKKTITFWYDDEEFGPFDTMEQAKETFMTDTNIIIDLDCLLSAEDQMLFVDIDDEEEAEKISEWEDAISDLTWNIWVRNRRVTPETVTYEFEGTPNDLIKFMKNYTAHWDPNGNGFDKDTVGTYFVEERRKLLDDINQAFNSNERGFFNPEQDNK